MSFRIERKPFWIGRSRVLTLPIAWCNYHGNKADKLTLIGDDVLILAPQGMEETAQRVLDEIKRTSREEERSE